MAFGDVQVGDAGVALVDGFLARGIDLHGGHQGGRVPGFEQGLGEEQVAGGAGMHAIGKDLGGVGGVGGIGLLQGVHHGGVDIRQAELLFGRQLFEEIAVAHQDLVVAAFEGGGARHVVVGRGLHEGDARGGKLALEGVQDVLVAGGELVENRLVEGAVAAVVHAEHDGDHGGIEGQDVAPDAHVHGAASAAGDAVAAPAGMHHADVGVRESRHHVGFGEGGVEALIGDAVAEEDDAVAIAQRKGVLGGGGAGGGQEEGQCRGMSFSVGAWRSV